MREPFHLFERFGVELEYMIVDRDSLDVLPVTDRLLHGVCGAFESEVERGALSWSNELVLHVVELKTNGPAPALAGLADLFWRHAVEINDRLAPLNGMLLPTSMHPWMDPDTQTRLWPHDYNAVYEAFNRIFDCRGHGWSNLQSTHLNLPFAGDEEFGRLHAAIRLMLPILPALAASSPVHAGRIAGPLDGRLAAYRQNSRRIPSVTGKVIPEPVFTRRDYEEQILHRVYRDLAPHDADGILQYEWANARGAIARFDRSTIEIRVLDIQECPQSDLAILELIVRSIRALVEQRWASFARQCAWPVDPLHEILLATERDGDSARIANSDYLSAFGLKAASGASAGELWQHLFETLFTAEERDDATYAPLRLILREGCLARRITQALEGTDQREDIEAIYRELGRCLADNRLFRAASCQVASQP